MHSFLSDSNTFSTAVDIADRDECTESKSIRGTNIQRIADDLSNAFAVAHFNVVSVDIDTDLVADHLADLCAHFVDDDAVTDTNTKQQSFWFAVSFLTFSF